MYFCREILGYEDVNWETHGKLIKYLLRDDLPYKLILMPRGHLKTSVVTIGQTLQRYLKEPNTRTLIVNATGSNAKAFMRSIQTHIISNNKFREIYGQNEYGTLGFDPDTWNQNEIVLPRDGILTEPSIKVKGLSATSVSQHYDRIVLDDLVVRENIGTSDQIKKVIQYYRDCEDLLEPDGEMIVIGTRWHWGDLYGWLMDNLPGTFSEPLVMEAVSKGDLDKGKILFPQKFTRKRLKQLKENKGPYEFSCQYLNNPTAPEDAVFQRRWFRYYKFVDQEVHLFDTNKKIREKFDKLLMNNYLTVDPAISETRDSDFSALVIASVDEKNRWFIRETIRLKLRPSELVAKIYGLAVKYNVKKIGVESVSFQKSLIYELEREMKEQERKFRVVEIRPDTRVTKTMRIASLQPRYSRGLIYHTLDMRDGDLETELLHHPRPVRDDLSDALSNMNEIVAIPRDDSNVIYEQPAEAAYERANPYTGW